MTPESLPLVSCVMPTYGRPAFMGESVGMFLDQDYPNKELIILNDCQGQTYECPDPSVRVINAPARFRTLGEKRNDAIQASRGKIIAVWDDDDVYLPWRVSFSVSEMQRLETPFYRPAEFWAYWGEDLLHRNESVPGWVSHGGVLFSKSLWRLVGGYPPIGLGEDADFFERIHRSLGQQFIKHPLPEFQRGFVLRGKSYYHHMSIGGGQNALDTNPGTYRIEPVTIQDPVLRRCCDTLVSSRLATLGATNHVAKAIAVPEPRPSKPHDPALPSDFVADTKSGAIHMGPEQRGFAYITALYNERQPNRADEYCECLKRVRSHPLIQSMHVLYEQSHDDDQSHVLRYLRDHGINTITTKAQPQFNALFEYANLNLHNARVIIANADIFFDDSLAMLLGRDMRDERMCLSRWNVQPNSSGSELFSQADSQDVWIFQAPLRPMSCPFPMGRLGCDNRLAYEAKVSGLQVLNPCRTIKCHHLHLTGVRNYTSLSRLGGPYAVVPQTSLYPRPMMVKADINHCISCNAEAGHLHGRHIAIEDAYGTPNIGYWCDSGDFVSWEVASAFRTPFTVTLEYALSPDSAGAEIAIAFGPTKILVPLATTRSWADFRVASIGTVQLERGQQTITVRPLRKPGHAVMNLRRIVFVPIPQSNGPIPS